MYQVPVSGLEKIRRSRKNVKTILSEFGLEQCELLSKEVDECDPGEEAFNDTDWSDLTVGFHGRRRKKWTYRTQALCCSLCRYSARSWNTFHGHIKCYHPHERNVAILSACSACPFIGHPRVLKRHFAYFHSDLPKPQLMDSGLSPVRPAAVEKYICKKCSYEDPLLYCIKKHVLFRHCLSLWYQHAGQRTQGEQAANTRLLKYYCKSCGTTAETTEHLVYHILTSVKHKDLDAHIHGFILQKLKQKKSYPVLAPKAQLTLAPQTIAPQTVSTNLTLLNPVQTSIPVAASSSNQLPVTGGPPSGVVLQGLSSSSSPVVSGQGTTQLLPAQAAALVQLASAEAKGLLRPDVPVTLTGAQPAKVVSDPGLSAMSTMGPSTPLQSVMANKAVGVSAQPMPKQFAIPPRASLNIPGQMPSGLAPQPAGMVPNQATPRATMLTSQSLLSHLIPTGNKVNGLPTYTLAPLQVNLPVQSGKGPIVSNMPVPVSQKSAKRAPGSTTVESGKAKKWITCSFCKELFPSNVYHVHMEVHKLKSKTGLAARAPFLKKMPDKTVKCLMCKVLLSEKGLFEHMRHGMSCLYCPGLFYSIKHLIEHIVSDHNPLEKENCDLMRREYRLYSDECGNILFPYFDINTTAPKEILADKEVNLALVTSSLDLIFVKMLPTAAKPVCQGSTKANFKECPFCSEELMSAEDTRIHLRERHFITPTIHAILKTPAYKCVYCGGVYTGKTTTKAITVHLQRCKCAPKTPIDVESLLNTRPMVTQPLKPVQPNQLSTSASQKAEEPESEVEVQRKLRLEMAVKEAMEANKREREARAARKKLEREKQASFPVPPPEPDSSVQLTMDTTGMWKRSFEDRREFLTKYFHAKPYLTKTEMSALANQLLLNKSDVACHFGTKRTKCMRAMQKNKAKVLLGFNMAELRKVKHNLYVPEIEPEREIEQSNSEDESEEDEAQDEEMKAHGTFSDSGEELTLRRPTCTKKYTHTL